MLPVLFRKNTKILQIANRAAKSLAAVRRSEAVGVWRLG